jgi:hypothetical protein
LNVFFFRFKICVASPWCSTVEDVRQMSKKLEFIEKYTQLSKRISKQRLDILKHHFEFVMKQTGATKIDDNPITKAEVPVSLQEDSKVAKNNDQRNNNRVKIKYMPGGGPSKTRVIIDEKYKLPYQEISKLREYSHFICEKNVEKMDLELKEKTQKIMLPLIKRS